MRIPSAASRSPPMPKVSSDGSSAFSSRTTSEAWRSPEASPATMASFMYVYPGPRRRRRIWRLRSDAGASKRQIPRFARDKSGSFERRVVHQPRQGDAAEDQSDEHLEEKPDPLFARALPQ